MKATATTPGGGRGLRHHPLGKCSAVLEIAMPEQMRQDIVSLAGLGGQKQTASEFARDALSVHLYGRVAMVQEILSR